MKSNGNEFVKMNQIIDEMAAGKANRTSNVDGNISDTDAAAFVNSVHQIQDAALRKAYQEAVNGVEKAIRAIEDAERLVSDGNDVLTRFDEEIKPLTESDGTMHVIHMNNKVLRSTRELSAFRESIVDGRAFECLKEEANIF